MKQSTFADYVSKNGLYAVIGTMCTDSTHDPEFRAILDAPSMPNNRNLQVELPLTDFWVLQKKPRQMAIVPYEDVAAYFKFNEQVLFTFVENNYLIVFTNESKQPLSGAFIHNVLIIEGQSRATACNHLHEVRAAGDFVILYTWGRCTEILPYLLPINQEEVHNHLRDGTFFSALRGNTPVDDLLNPDIVQQAASPPKKVSKSKSYFAGAGGHFTE